MSRCRYFLSAYLTPPGEGSILHPRHDQNVALWAVEDANVELVRCWELERLSGQKNHRWPLFAQRRFDALISTLLAEVDLRSSDIEASWGTPGLPNSVPLRTPRGGDAFPLHSLAHLYSGLFLDSSIQSSETIVAMAIDGGPDFTLDRDRKEFWYAGCVSKGGETMFRPVSSPAPLYDAAEAVFGLQPGSLMALASATTAAIEFDLKPDLAALSLRGGTNPVGEARAFVGRVVSEVERQLQDAWPDERFSPAENRCSAVMKVLQACCEGIAKRNLTELCEFGNVDPTSAYLSITGGFGLNCPANTAMMDEFGFRALLTPPCPNDSGQAVGIGLMGLHGAGLLSNRTFQLQTAYVGSAVLEADEALSDMADVIAGMQDFDPAVFVSDLIAGPVAWVDGSAELGPRALGHRSLLADPRTIDAKVALNTIKQRQWWRPVAPIVLEGSASEWFDLQRRSPFMLEVGHLQPDKTHLAPGIVHLDGTARVQTLAQTENPLLYRALNAFYKATGVPMLCNTSLNDRGEPIVADAAQAINFCVRKQVRVLYLSGRRIEFVKSLGSCLPDRPATRARDLFSGQEAERTRVYDAWLAKGYSPIGVFLLAQSPELRTAMAGPLLVNRLAHRLATTDEIFAEAAAEYLKGLGPDADFREGEQRQSTVHQSILIEAAV